MVPRNVNYRKSPKLGEAVKKHLSKKGVDSIHVESADLSTSHKQSFRRIFSAIMTNYMERVAHEKLEDTCARVDDMWRQELLYGLSYSNFPAVQMTKNERYRFSQIILVDNIPIRTICRHHLMPVFGYAWIAYIPDDRIMGLSKFSRVVDFFAARPQAQEDLQMQLMHTFQYLLHTENVGIGIRLCHSCMFMRGVCLDFKNANTYTQMLQGDFIENPELKNELVLMPKFAGV